MVWGSRYSPGGNVAKAILVPKRFTILFFFLGLAAALIGGAAIIDMGVIMLTELTGRAESVDPAASLFAIISALGLLIIMARSQQAIIALLAGFIVGCLVQFLILLPGA